MVSAFGNVMLYRNWAEMSPNVNSNLNYFNVLMNYTNVLYEE